MNSHFQSSETTCTSIGLLCDSIGLKGSRACAPIQITPPRNTMTRRGIPQTSSSIRPEYTQSGRYCALGFEARNHQAKASVATIVGTTIASMIASALYMILRFAAPIGPCGSSTPPEQSVSDNSSISAIDIRNGRLREIECGNEHRDVDNLSRVESKTRFITDP